MIAHLRGILREASPLHIVIEAGGVGYEVHVPLTTAEKLPVPGKEASLHIHAVYREDSQTLYGFAQRTERDFFRVLVEKVSGIGPRIALSMMSKLSLPVLQQAIAEGNANLIAQTPGVGKKTAERVIVELRDKMGALATIGDNRPAGDASSSGASTAAGSTTADAVAALVSLGYKAAEADKAVRAAQSALGADADTEALIRRALATK